jgi:thiamine biosynthesis lipoprotein
MRRWLNLFRLVVVVLAVVHTAAAQPSTLQRYEATRLSMATVYAIEAYGPDASRLRSVVSEAFDEVDRIDRLMSHYKTDSALSRLNREAAHHPVSIEPELFDLIATSMRYSRDSDGAFDITVGPLMKAWGFFRGEGSVPSQQALEAARRHVGYAHVQLRPESHSVAFDADGVELDLGGIAKGYAVDRVASLLRERQVPAALISAGGSSIYAMGAPPGSAGWEISIQDPVDSRKIARTVTITDRAVSVSGSAEKSFESNGVTYSHIMDPRTGRPVQGMLSVTVLTTTATAGDALDNALFVLGRQGSRKLWPTLSATEAYFFMPDGRGGWTMAHEATK